MKTADTAPEGGAVALVGFPMKSSKCKFILLRGMNLHGGLFWGLIVWGFFSPCGLFSFSYIVVSAITLNINQIIHETKYYVFKVLKSLLLVAFK